MAVALASLRALLRASHAGIRQFSAAPVLAQAQPKLKEQPEVFYEDGDIRTDWTCELR